MAESGQSPVFGSPPECATKEPSLRRELQERGMEAAEDAQNTTAGICRHTLGQQQPVAHTLSRRLPLPQALHACLTAVAHHLRGFITV